MLLIDPLEKINSFFVYEDEEFKALKGYIIYYEKNEGMHEYMLENKLKPANDDYRLISEFASETEQTAEDAFESARSKSSDLRAARLRRRTEKKAAGLMSTLSFVMLMVCFVMGAGLVQNDKRINELELNVAELKNEFDAADSAQSVFAADAMAVENTEQTTVETTFETTLEPTTFTETQTEKAHELSKYRVEKGDTLSRISEKIYGTIGMIEDIMQLNGMENADDLTEGTQLVLPEE
ncbi:MAG: LysM peptidoglycan-binding domain-containing protein, partial [Firmicutes bacterium]|nr:LysM peptidoglycan-binding domain-containing protein [Bacillota bacterium]